MPVPAGGGDVIPEPDRLATTESLAALLQIPVDELDEDAAGVAIEASTAVVQAAVGGQRILQVVDDEVTIYGSPSSYLELPQRPVIAATSVTYAGAALTSGTASGNWRLCPGGLWRDVGWVDVLYEPSPAVVVYTHGYPEGDQRLQLARSATLSLARGVYGNPGGATSLKIDDYAEAYDRASAGLEASRSLQSALRRQYGRPAGLVRVS